MIDTSSDIQWLIKAGSASEKINALRKELNGVHPVLCDILLQRGIDSKVKAEFFFRPKLDQLNDPWLMLDMDLAVDRLSKAKDTGQKVMVLGDYDVDGTTSAAMMYLFLKSIEVACDYYIPDRYKEGYGISIDSIDHAVKSGFSLMICLDCGIKAIDKVQYANEKGLDLIICDHHTPGSEIPKAVAVLDPKREGCTYPFKELSGCGVGFKLIQAMLDRLALPAENAHAYLDLLATSIAADMVPIVDENRVLTMYGLHKVNANPSIGIRAMKDSTTYNKEYKTSDLVFKIAPRINAAGRMSSGSKAVEILVSDNLDQALELANRVNEYNLERRETDTKMTEEALSALELNENFLTKKSTVLYDPSWHKGVIGIVASRMIENYYRPTIIFSGDGDVLSGSARSVRNFSVYKAIEACKDLLIQYGGHMYAAGMTMKKENFEAFCLKFEEVVSSTIEPESLLPSLDIDAEMKVNEIDLEFFKILRRLGPFGPENMSPVFLSKSLLAKEVMPVGKLKNHLKLIVFDPEYPQKTVRAIAFGFGELAEHIVDGVMIDVVYSIEENAWNGRSELQLNIKDIRV